MKKHPFPFRFTFAVYAITGIFAILLFYINGSYLSHQIGQSQSSDRTSEVSMITPASKDIDVVGIVDTPDKAENTPQPEIEPIPEEEPADPPVADDADTQPEKIYYGFTVVDGITALHVRETNKRNGRIIHHMHSGDKGFILEKDDRRSYVVLDNGIVGYVFNTYIEISEISKEEFPEEYR